MTHAENFIAGNNEVIIQAHAKILCSSLSLESRLNIDLAWHEIATGMIVGQGEYRDSFVRY